MKERYRRSKRIFTQYSLALVLLMASVFLVGGEKVSAQAIEPKFQPSIVSPLQEQQLIIEQLDVQFKTKAQLIEEKAKEVEAVKEEVAKVVEVKQSIEAEVTNIKDEIQVLQAKIAEKKRLEALRIVPFSRNAPDSSGNTYALGNCTYYVKQKRPDLSNGLGNANTWYYRAQAKGYKTGTMAKTGAVGTTTRGALGHVVYVEKWLGNGKILISEMNVNGLWSMQTRVADESEFVYIYELN